MNQGASPYAPPAPCPMFLGISLPVVFGEGLVAETLAAGHAHALQFCVGGAGPWQQQPLLQGEAVEVGTDVLDAETAAEPDQFLMELQVLFMILKYILKRILMNYQVVFLKKVAFI